MTLSHSSCCDVRRRLLPLQGGGRVGVRRAALDGAGQIARSAQARRAAPPTPSRPPPCRGRREPDDGRVCPRCTNLHTVCVRFDHRLHAVCTLFCIPSPPRGGEGQRAGARRVRGAWCRMGRGGGGGASSCRTPPHPAFGHLLPLAREKEKQPRARGARARPQPPSISSPRAPAWRIRPTSPPMMVPFRRMNCRSRPTFCSSFCTTVAESQLRMVSDTSRDTSEP